MKRNELSKLMQAKINNQQVFQTNLDSLHNVKEHINKKILAPNMNDNFDFEAAIVDGQKD